MLPSERTTRWQGTTTGIGWRGAGTADGADRLRISGQLSNGGVAGGMAIADLRQATEDGAPESDRQPPVQRQVESAAAAREVLLELPRGQVQAGRGMKDARADLVRESLEYSVVVLAGVGDADQALLSRGEQQRPDRAVDDRRRTEDAVAVGIGDELVVQPTEVAGSCREGRARSGPVVVSIGIPSILSRTAGTPAGRGAAPRCAGKIASNCCVTVMP